MAGGNALKRLPLSALLAVLALSAASAQEASSAWTIEGGRWQQGAAGGTYRIVVEHVGFEHVSCRVGIAWMAAATTGRPAAVLAEVPFAELSNGFWACDADAEGVRLDGDLLAVRATHTYSGQPRTFTVRLGTPGRYRCEDCGAP
ncbi:hypothetical protein [Stenotrophomonas nitritireducens]|uniref:hypothetical protein n=1 Tax=Stenotrophomonas nitritireducens TaxID=83617 RepID=UPI003D994C01